MQPYDILDVRPNRDLELGDIEARLLAMMLSEAVRAVSERVVRKPRDGDVRGYLRVRLSTVSWWSAALHRRFGPGEAIWARMAESVRCWVSSRLAATRWAGRFRPTTAIMC